MQNMDRIVKINSIAVPWLMADIDTDVITPMRRLLYKPDKLDIYSFEAYRYLGGDADNGDLNPEFPLNQERYSGARIMIVGDNFGCGSSRETAAEAIRMCGYVCLIGSGFGNIFYKNCFQQRVLPVVFPKETVEDMAEQAGEGGLFTVDVKDRLIVTPDGITHPFQLDDYHRKAFLEGLDDVETTLLKRDEIEAYYVRDRQVRQWLYDDLTE